MSLGIQLKAYADLVDARLDELLPAVTQPPSELHEAMRYSCLAPGKRLRPALCMASAEAVGGAARAVLDAACAVEMVHCFSLIHDDLPAIDNDDLRRGRPTCHRQFSEALAILAGDALFALAFQALAGCPQEPSLVLRAVAGLTRAAGSEGLVGGEVVDILSEGKDPDAELLQFIHSRKTGALISASCEIGGVLGGGDDVQVSALRKYGAEIGLAFQIADDLLNETAASEQLGKATGSDRHRKKLTYPSVFGIEGARQAAYKASAAGQAHLRGLPQAAPLLDEIARFTVERLS